MRGDLDLARDHVSLITRTMTLLTDDGELYFTANLRTFELDVTALLRAGLAADDVTRALTPEDFSRHPRFRAFRIHRA